jgi:hypothetical protein
MYTCVVYTNVPHGRAATTGVPPLFCQAPTKTSSTTQHLYIAICNQIQKSAVYSLRFRLFNKMQLCPMDELQESKIVYRFVNGYRRGQL